jgi:hypothetical protein
MNTSVAMHPSVLEKKAEAVSPRNLKTVAAEAVECCMKVVRARAKTASSLIVVLIVLLLDSSYYDAFFSVSLFKLTEQCCNQTVNTPPFYD